jgi:hypothetical protein
MFSKAVKSANARPPKEFSTRSSAHFTSVLSPFAFAGEKVFFFFQEKVVHGGENGVLIEKHKEMSVVPFFSL